MEFDYSKTPGKKIEKVGELINKEKPTISIITPFYNGGKTLMETANAIFSQTYPFFEWLIIDDGSKDKESLDKLEELKKMDKRVKVFHKENAGPSVARDFGIEKSSKETKYIFFIDCDDLPEKTMLECLYWTLETHPDCSFAYPATVSFGSKEFLWEKYLSIDGQIVENLISICAMVKKEDLLEVGCFGIKEKSMFEDWNLWLKLIAKGKKPIRVSAPLFWYRISESGELSRAKKNKKNAMKYIKETSKTIKDGVEIIQYPREGNQFATVKDRSYMILPKYERDKKKKTVLFMFPWMVVGGADYFNLELIKRLNKDEYNLIVLTTTPNINVLRQQFSEYTTELYDMTTFLERSDFINFTDYMIESRNVDIVVISNTQYGYYMVPYLKEKYPKVSFVDYIHSVDLHDPREGFGRCTMDVNNYLSKTYCCNNFTKKQLEERYHKTNVETLYIGTDSDKFDPNKFNKDEIRDKYNISKDKIVISFIARLAYEKRPEMFIEIGKELLKNHNNVHFVIAGDGPLMNDVIRKTDRNFSILGMIKDTEEVYALSDITVNCSSLEGLALTSYESLSMGVPVISTDVGGQTELIDDKVGGIVHYNKDATKEVYLEEVNQYVKEIERVIKNLDKIKNNCRKRIIDSFSIDLLVKNFSKAINNNIEKEKNNKSRIQNTYIDYNFVIEALYKDYLYYCEQYYCNQHGLYYDENTNRVRTGKKFRIRNSISVFLRKRNAKDDAARIIDYLKSLKKLFKAFAKSIKLLLLAIPAFFKLIFKLIFKF